MVETGAFLLNLLFIVLAIRHTRFCFLPISLAFGLLAYNFYTEPQVLISAYYAALVLVSIFGLVNWGYLESPLVKLKTNEIIPTFLAYILFAIGGVGIMSFYNEEHPVLSALMLSTVFLWMLLLSRGIHDGWLLKGVMFLIFAIVSIVLGEPLNMLKFVFLGLASCYVFIDWSLDYYGKIEIKLVE